MIHFAQVNHEERPKYVLDPNIYQTIFPFEKY